MRGLHWFRCDLRLSDNTALAVLAARAEQWLPIFILDPRLLAGPRAGEARTRFLFDCLARLRGDLAERDVPLVIREGRPEELVPRLVHETGAQLLSWNEDSTPFARRRDAAVRSAVERAGGEVLVCPDRVVFRAGEVVSGKGEPYRVYTPYRKAWWKRWAAEPRLPTRQPRLPPAIPGFAGDALPKHSASVSALELPTGGEQAALRRLRGFLSGAVGDYASARDRPDLDGTSRLSPYLHFGALSVRQCFARAEEAVRAQRSLRGGVAKWLDELIWREFYAAILERHPRVLLESYRSEYADLEWNDDPEKLAAWREGLTGYPFVDAGMRQLRATAWMHNRARMVTASFLTKQLGIDWREGERVFFERLVDGDLAANNGNWQWSASTGTDAQPYFRVFNPVRQGQRFDPHGAYVRRWIPELEGLPDAVVHQPWKARGGPPAGYPQPIVKHAEGHAMALARFRKASSSRAGLRGG